MSKVKLNLIAAACENMGIGVNGTLPWRLKEEMHYFTTMTTKVTDAKKKNAVIMGRRTYECIPDKFRPLHGRINIVLTRSVDEIKRKVPNDVVVLSSIDEAIKYIESSEDIEKAWVIGGADIYKIAMAHPNCNKIYLTEIQNKFECDTFFPTIDRERFELVQEEGVPTELQREGDVRYYYRIYHKM